MQNYHPFNPESTSTVSETLTITNGQIQLRHIPRQSSVTIPGFIETTALVVPAGRFRVDYFDANGEYRECSRKIYFNAADNGKSVSVGYSAVGTPVTAADMNEIKNHMANSTLHGGGEHPITAAQVSQMVAHMANTSIHGGGGGSTYTLPVADENTLGGVKISEDFVTAYDGTLYLNDDTDFTERRIDSNIHFYGKTDELWESGRHGDLLYVTPEKRFYIWDGNTSEWLPFKLGGGAGTNHSKTLTGGPAYSVDWDEDGKAPVWTWVIVDSSGFGDSAIYIPEEVYNSSYVTVHDDTNDVDLVKGSDWSMYDWEPSGDWYFFDNGYEVTIQMRAYCQNITISWR